MANKILKNSNGVALLMVLTTITLLAAILVDFTFDMRVNKYKVSNIQDKAKAKLNAEAALKLGLARLRLYQEAYNVLKKNKNAQAAVQTEKLNLIWSIPFIYPIPQAKGINLIQKNSIDKFEKDTLLEGEMKLLVQNASNRININLLRISKFEKKNNNQQQGQQQQQQNQQTDPFNVEGQLVKMLSDAIDNKKENDETFDDKYADIDPKKMIAAIKYAVSDKESYEDDEYIPDFESWYSDQETTPKFAPFNSMREILTLPHWNRELLKLIEAEITVHGVVKIDLNKITKKTLLLLLPDINEDQIKEFFKYRDDPKEPHYFNKIEDFENYIVKTASVMAKADFDKRMNQFKKAGIEFGVIGSLFKVLASGKYERSSYSITAHVALPAKPIIATPTPTPTVTPVPNPAATPSPTPTPIKQAEQLLAPRVLEIIIN